jgi:ABC-type multidrug transport system fused ATPase/permease subunit
MHYTAYGLHIASELILPELMPGPVGQPDVYIRFGHVPTSLASPHSIGDYFQASPGTFLLKVPDTAHYLVVKGREIWINQVNRCGDDEVRLFLLGSAFGALLHQRHILAMHASAIQTARGAVLFVGPSGNGKSTLVAAFLHRGYRMLADDVTGVIVDAASGPVALPA